MKIKSPLTLKHIIITAKPIADSLTTIARIKEGKRLPLKIID
jgi:hypothetical protein